MQPFTMTLDTDPETFHRWLHVAADEVGRVHAGLRHPPVTRRCTVNHRTTRADVEELLAVVRELGAALAPAPRGALR